MPALTSRAAAEAYVCGVCFKQGPPELVGAELEWLTEQGDGRVGSRICPDRLAAALGEFAPTTITPTSAALPLPRGSSVSVEPGGQIELSSSPCESAECLCRALAADTAFLRGLLGTRSYHMVCAAADAHRPARRILESPRYRAMEARYARSGCFGALMMCNTASTQVSVDAGVDPGDIGLRWRTLYAIGPALVAAFGCSPAMAGAPPGRWASQRMRAWLQLDPVAIDAGSWSDPIARYGAWVLDAPILCLRPERGRGGGGPVPPGAGFADWIGGALDNELGSRPEVADLDYHLTAVFPLVRAHGHLEVRYVDAQPAVSWADPIFVIAALMNTPQTRDEAARLARSTAECWHEAARVGLGDLQLRRTAVELLDLAASAADSPTTKARLAAAASRCAHGTAPHQSDRP